MIEIRWPLVIENGKEDGFASTVPCSGNIVLIPNVSWSIIIIGNRYKKIGSR